MAGNMCQLTRRHRTPPPRPTQRPNEWPYCARGQSLRGLGPSVELLAALPPGCLRQALHVHHLDDFGQTPREYPEKGFCPDLGEFAIALPFRHRPWGGVRSTCLIPCSTRLSNETRDMQCYWPNGAMCGFITFSAVESNGGRPVVRGPCSEIQANSAQIENGA